MLEHARELLERVGYGTAGAPDFEVGIGLDFGEAFIGNIGDDRRARLHRGRRRRQHRLAPPGPRGGRRGRAVRSARALLPTPVGVPEQLELKGKQEPVPACRVRWFAPDG